MTGMWTNELLDHMRQEADPLADAAVTEIIETGRAEAFGNLMKCLVSNRDEIPASLPPKAREFFEQTQRLPTWADLEKIALGEEVFVVHGPEMITMLLLTSLPNSYRMAKGALMLTMTAQLTKHFHHRIFRTAQFIADVMQAGGLSPTGRGIRSAQKVRVIHAYTRYAIKHKPDWQQKWNLAWGEPVNQEDMANTLLDFSVSVLRGIEKTGIRLSVAETEAYHHCWRVVGHVLGLDPRLQAPSVVEAYSLADMIAARQAGESEAGKELTRDLINFVQGHLPRWLDGFAATTIRYFSGNDVANMLKAGSYNWTLAILYLQIGLMRLMDALRRIHPRLKKHMRFLTWQLMHQIVSRQEGDVFHFELSDELRSAWRLPTHRGETSTVH